MQNRILFIPVIILFFTACRITPADAPFASGTQKGYELAQKHCASCHSFVPAKFLDQQTWMDYILPQMAPNVGIGVFGEKDYINSPNKPSAVTYKEWMEIIKYYQYTSPEKLLPVKPPVPIIKDWRIFDLKTANSSLPGTASTTLTYIDTATQSIFTSDGFTNYLYRWNNQMNVTDSVLLGSSATSVELYNDAAGARHGVFSTLGGMETSEFSNGQLLDFNIDQKLAFATDTLADKLPRPVQQASGDFNHDGLRDWLVCGFGHNTGALLQYTRQLSGTFEKKIIFPLPGAINLVVRDFNKDGWDDVMVLFAHADECIRLFINDRNGSFTNKKLLSFTPVHGSTSFEVADFNKDGLPDILYSCGDNADISKILKPYHGVYIFLNKGDFKFEQAYFYPVNGCTKAMAVDFDGDGDLDLATIAFFADFKNNPAEKFIYFEQTGALSFQPYSPPINKNGRWICMDVKDYDQDGDPDIVLGNFAQRFLNDRSYNPVWDMQMPIIVLENNHLK